MLVMADGEAKEGSDNYMISFGSTLQQIWYSVCVHATMAGYRRYLEQIENRLIVFRGFHLKKAARTFHTCVVAYTMRW